MPGFLETHGPVDGVAHESKGVRGKRTPGVIVERKEDPPGGSEIVDGPTSGDIGKSAGTGPGPAIGSHNVGGHVDHGKRQFVPGCGLARFVGIGRTSGFPGDSISISYSATDASATVDSIGSGRFAMWPGDNSGGHRSSGQTEVFAASDDTFSVSSARIFGATNTANTVGDNVGVLFGIRDEPATSGTRFFRNVSISGNINQDDSGIVFTPVPEPSSIALFGMGLLGLVGNRRRK